MNKKTLKPSATGRELTLAELAQIPNLLLISSKPLTTQQIARILDPDNSPSIQGVEDALKDLVKKPIQQYFPGLELIEVAQGWRFQIKFSDGAMIHRLFNEKKPRYSRSILETLAIIAWRGPVTRGDIENIRGVTVSTHIIRTLLDRDWIASHGHRDTTGKPELLITTKQFLDDFSLKTLSDLPTLDDLFDAENIPSHRKSDLENLEQSLGLFAEDKTTATEPTEIPIQNLKATDSPETENPQDKPQDN